MFLSEEKMILIFTFTLILYVADNSVLCQTNSHLHNDEFDYNEDLLLVQLVFRHGERTPLTFYKNDPWKDDIYWDDKPGQLTNVGKHQPFELGKYMRRRYAGFLNSSFNENEVYAQSSKIDRTIMTAEAFLAGMYSPERPTDFFNTHLPWHPFPVHTTPTKLDNLIHNNLKCDALKGKFDAVMGTDEVKEFNRKHKDLYQYLSLHTGELIENMSDIVPIQDTLMIEALHNRSLPEWTNKVFPGGDLYDSMQEAFFKWFTMDTSTPQLAKIRGGFLLKDILDRFTNKSKSILNPDRKLWIYSGHDTTISRLLNTLGILESVPDFSTCVIFEMRNVDNAPHIEIYLKNSSTEPMPLSIPHCGVPCPLDDFYILYRDVLPTESFAKECQASSGLSSSAQNASGLVLLTVTLAVMSKYLLYRSGA